MEHKSLFSYVVMSSLEWIVMAVHSQDALIQKAFPHVGYTAPCRTSGPIFYPAQPCTPLVRVSPISA